MRQKYFTLEFIYWVKYPINNLPLLAPKSNKVFTLSHRKGSLGGLRLICSLQCDSLPQEKCPNNGTSFMLHSLQSRENEQAVYEINGENVYVTSSLAWKRVIN